MAFYKYIAFNRYPLIIASYIINYIISYPRLREDTYILLITYYYYPSYYDFLTIIN